MKKLTITLISFTFEIIARVWVLVYFYGIHPASLALNQARHELKSALEQAHKAYKMQMSYVKFGLEFWKRGCGAGHSLSYLIKNMWKTFLRHLKPENMAYLENATRVHREMADIGLRQKADMQSLTENSDDSAGRVNSDVNSNNKLK